MYYVDVQVSRQKGLPLPILPPGHSAAFGDHEVNRFRFVFYRFERLVPRDSERYEDTSQPRKPPWGSIYALLRVLIMNIAFHTLAWCWIGAEGVVAEPDT
jgi:hypothetical protein